MEKILAKLKSEPVRVRLYGILVIVGALLVAKGYVSATDMESYISLAVLILGVESARAKVSPAPGPKHRA